MMSKMWQPLSPITLREWVNAILEEASDELSDWENGFISSIDTQLSSGRQLSQKQEKILERIYAEKTK